jgi:hypothetical protein
VVIPWLKATPCHDIDLNAQKLLQILEQADMVKKRGSGLEVDKQIDTTARMGLPPGDRAERSNPVSPSLARDFEDLAVAAQPICDHCTRSVCWPPR